VGTGAARAALAIAIIGFAAPAISAAQPAEKPTEPPAPGPPASEYKRHLDLGVKLFNDRNFGAAVAEFEAAYRAEPKANPLINIALSQKAQFQYPAAIATLEKALSEHGDTMSEKDRSATGRAILEMKSLLAHLRLEISPAHATVTVDGARIESAQSAALPVGPGTHHILVTAEGYQAESRSVTVASGDRDVLVQVQLTPSPRPQGGEEESRHSMPEVPPPPPQQQPRPDDAPHRGVYALVTASLMFPATHPWSDAATHEPHPVRPALRHPGWWLGARRRGVP